MKSSLVSLLLCALLLCSCKSEYHERLDQAKELKEKMMPVQASNDIIPRKQLIYQINSINEEIRFLAKISGNEELFLKEVYAD